jgi:hypothetical protein
MRNKRELVRTTVPIKQPVDLAQQALEGKRMEHTHLVPAVLTLQTLEHLRANDQPAVLSGNIQGTFWER